MFLFVLVKILRLDFHSYIVHLILSLKGSSSLRHGAFILGICFGVDIALDTVEHDSAWVSLYFAAFCRGSVLLSVVLAGYMCVAINTYE